MTATLKAQLTLGEPMLLSLEVPVLVTRTAFSTVIFNSWSDLFQEGPRHQNGATQCICCCSSPVVPEMGSYVPRRVLGGRKGLHGTARDFRCLFDSLAWLVINDDFCFLRDYTHQSKAICLSMLPDSKKYATTERHQFHMGIRRSPFLL